MADFESFVWNAQSVLLELESLRDQANKLGLECTSQEISSARSRIDSVLFEAERKTEPEFAPYRDGGPSVVSEDRTHD